MAARGDDSYNSWSFLAEKSVAIVMKVYTTAASLAVCSVPTIELLGHNAFAVIISDQYSL